LGSERPLLIFISDLSQSFHDPAFAEQLAAAWDGPNKNLLIMGSGIFPKKDVSVHKSFFDKIRKMNGIPMVSLGPPDIVTTLNVLPPEDKKELESWEKELTGHKKKVNF